MSNLIELIKQRAQDTSTIHDMAQGHSPAPRINTKAGPADVEDAKKALGFKLPQLLNDIYTQIGNRGFGSGYGIYELSTVIKIYQDNINKPTMNWPKGWLPILTWGCTYEICIDCLSNR